jgi:hypothetical protein
MTERNDEDKFIHGAIVMKEITLLGDESEQKQRLVPRHECNYFGFFRKPTKT